ncbi:MAG TPA: hypothetical protein VGK19_02100 [Capsulimonadaceae bacterium]|jgi:hypothetical protein
MSHTKLIISALAGLVLLTPVFGDEPKPVTLNISKDQVRTVDAIAVLQKETGAIIVVDGTVIGTLNQCHVSFPTLAKMLDFLKTMEPGLTYQRIYLPSNRPTPNADQCYDIARTLTWLSEQGNVSLTNQAGSIGIIKEPKAPTAIPTGMKEIWYISDEQMRNQRFLDAQKAEKERLQPSQPVTPTQPYTPQRWNWNQQATPGTQNTDPNRRNNTNNQQGGTIQVSPGLVIQQ